MTNSAVKSVINKTDSQVIKYHNLGFATFQDASAYYDTYSVRDHLGLVVDFHIEM